MDYRRFGRSGLYVSPLALGTWRLQRTPEAEIPGLIGAALDAGINLIDSAPNYGDGKAEEWIGRAIAERGGRDDILLATKCSGPKPRAPNGFNCTRRNIVASCERSLRRLRTDYIDLYQVHCVEPDVPADETLAALSDLVRAGKVRAIGCSNYTGWQMVENQWCACERGYARFTSDQSCYNLLDRRLEARCFPAMATYDMVELVYSPLASGHLTGKYLGGHDAIPSDGIYGGMSAEKYDQVYNPQMVAALEDLRAAADERGVTMTQLALAFVLDQPVVAAAIIGPRTREQLDENLGALDVVVDDVLRQRFDAICKPAEKIFGPGFNRYNHGRPSARWR